MIARERISGMPSLDIDGHKVPWAEAGFLGPDLGIDSRLVSVRMERILVK